MTRYRTIVADPPWMVDQHSRWDSGQTKGPLGHKRERRRPPYEVMTIGAIERLPVGELAEPDAHLYLWTINRYVEASYAIARAWGFEPKTLLTWAKTPTGMGPGGAFAQTSEHILFCRRGYDISMVRMNTTWWNWKRVEHSVKPDAFLDMVEQVSPGPYVELFARRARFGWDYWGNESLGTAEMIA